MYVSAMYLYMSYWVAVTYIIDLVGKQISFFHIYV